MPINSWDPMTGLFYDRNGNEVSEEDFYKQQSLAAGEAMGARALTPEEQASVASGTFTPPAGMGLYNAGNQTLLAPLNDPNFQPHPKNDGGGFLGGVIGTTATHLQDIANSYKQSPERPLLGINTPFEGGLWGGITGKDYSPTVTQAGQPTQATYDKAASRGYDTGPTQSVHDVAPAIVAAGSSGSIADAFPSSGTGVSGTSETGTLTGSTANDTLGSNNMGYFDDFSGQWVDGSAGGGGAVGDPNATGAFDQSGSQGVFDAQGNPQYTSPSGTLVNSSAVQEVARQLGITPAAALKYLMSGAGSLAAAGLGAYASNQQAGSLQALNNQYLGFGAPSRARYEASYAPGFTMANEPGYKDALDQTAKATLHGLSTQGNPAGSPNAWASSLSDIYQKTAYPALQTYRNQNANTGGIGTLTAAAPGAATGAINAQGNVFNAVGGGLNDIFNPPKSLAQQLAELKQSGYYA